MFDSFVDFLQCEEISLHDYDQIFQLLREELDN